MAATHGRWEIDTATRNSLYHGTFHPRPAHVMLILMLNATSSVGTLSVLPSRFSLSAKGAVHLSGLSEHHRRFIRICMLFLKKRAQRETVREWTISADANDTRQDDKVWWCVTQHITAGICGDAASYKYVAQCDHSRYVSESLGPGQLARHRCCMWHRAFPRYPKSVRTVVVETRERDVM